LTKVFAFSFDTCTQTDVPQPDCCIKYVLIKLEWRHTDAYITSMGNALHVEKILAARLKTLSSALAWKVLHS